MNKPLLVEVIAYAPTAYYHCTHCEVAWREMGVSNKFHQEQVGSSLPKELSQEYQVLSEWVNELFEQHGDHILVKVIDAASIEGVLASLRYGVRRFPAVIVGKKARFTGKDLQPANQEIHRLLEKEAI